MPNTFQDPDADQKYSPEEVSKRLSAMEEADPDLAKQSKDIDSQLGNESIRQAEEAGWRQNFSQGPKNSKSFIKGLAKKKGPLGGLIGIIVAVGLAFSSMTALLPVHLKELLLGNHNVSESAIETRGYRRMLNGLNYGATNKACTLAPFACKMKLMPDKMLKNMEIAGFKPLDRNGTPLNLESNRTTGQRAAKFEVKLDNGQTDMMDAKNMRKVLRSNPKLRNSWHTVYNPRQVGFWSSSFQNMMSRLKLSRKNPFAGKSAAEIEATYKNVTGEKSNAKIEKGNSRAESENTTQQEADRANNNRNAAADNTKTDFEEITKAKGDPTATKSAMKKLGGKVGGVTSLVVGLYCGATDFAKALSLIGRGIQIVQLTKYAMLFMNIADVIKSGDATPEQTAFIGKMLTEVSIDVKNNVRHSATDAPLMKFAMFGDSPTAAARGYSPVREGGWRNFIPGAGMVKNLNGAVDKVGANNESATGVCAFANTRAGTAVLDSAGGPWNILIGQGLYSAFQLAMPLLEPIIFKMAASIAGNITEDIYGEDVGNAVSSGTLLMLSSASMARSGSALAKNKIPSVMGYQRDYILAYAEEERATKSPFDISSPYTAMGSLVTQYLPAMASIGANFNLSQSFTALRGIFGMTVNSFSTSAHAAETFTERFIRVTYNGSVEDLCDDPHLEGLATTPVCSLISTIDPAYVDTPQDEVFANSNVANNIDDEGNVTGGKLKEWEEKCLTEDLNELNKFCNTSVSSDGLSSKDKSMMAIFFMDRDIDVYLTKGDQEGEGAGASGVSTSSPAEEPSTGSSEGDLPPAEGWTWPIKKGLRPGPCFAVSVLGRAHAGMDINSSVPRVPVYAMHDGKVLVANNSGGAAGKYVRIASSDGYYYIYQHLSEINVKTGDTIKSNQLVGKGGKTGRVFASSPVHLHIVVSTKNDFPSLGSLKSGIDPMKVLPSPAPDGYKCTR